MAKVGNIFGERKTLIWSIVAATIVIGGIAIGSQIRQKSNNQHTSASSKKKKKQRSKNKSGSPVTDGSSKAEEKDASEDSKKPEESPLPKEITEELLQTLSDEQKADLATRFKVKGNEAFSKNDLNKALKLYTQALQCKEDAIFYSNRAACHSALNDQQKVIEDTSKAIDLNKNYVKALNRRAAAYEAIGDNEKALMDATVSCILTSFVDTKMNNTVEQNLNKIAEKKCKEILEKREVRWPPNGFIRAYLDSLRPIDYSSLEFAPAGQDASQDALRQAIEYLEAKEFQKAFEQVNISIENGIEKTKPLASHAYNIAGTFYFLRNEISKAKESFDKAIEMDEKFTQNYVKRASLFLELQDKDAALNDLKKAESINSQDPDIYYHRGQIHYLFGEFQDALKDYQLSIDLDPEFVYAHIQFGISQYRVGSIASCMSTFRKTLKTFKKSSEAYNYYGELLLDQGNFTQAYEQFEKAIAIENKKPKGSINVLPLINKALAIFQERKDMKDAEYLCRHAIDLDPECELAVASLAQFLLQQGKTEEALKWFHRSVELARTEPEIMNALSYTEATNAQVKLTKERPDLANKLQQFSSSKA